eukprot:10939916-Prorocentrum_lima.AAC.1
MRSLGLAPEGERGEQIEDETVRHARQLAELTEAEKDAMVKEADGIEFSGCYWQRVDLRATTYQLTKEGGPPLESIVARSTINVDS